MKINKVIKIPCNLDDSFFLYWVEFLRPIHKLSAGYMNVFAELLKERYYLSKNITDSALLDKELFSIEEREKIRKKFGFTQQYMWVVLSKLKLIGIISDGRLNPKFIPDFSGDKFELVLLFDLNGNTKPKDNTESI